MQTGLKKFHFKVLFMLSFLLLSSFMFKNTTAHANNTSASGSCPSLLEMLLGGDQLHLGDKLKTGHHKLQQVIEGYYDRLMTEQDIAGLEKFFNSLHIDTKLVGPFPPSTQKNLVLNFNEMIKVFPHLKEMFGDAPIASVIVSFEKLTADASDIELLTHADQLFNYQNHSPTIYQQNFFQLLSGIMPGPVKSLSEQIISFHQIKKHADLVAKASDARELAKLNEQGRKIPYLSFLRTKNPSANPNSLSTKTFASLASYYTSLLTPSWDLASFSTLKNGAPLDHLKAAVEDATTSLKKLNDDALNFFSNRMNTDKILDTISAFTTLKDLENFQIRSDSKVIFFNLDGVLFSTFYSKQFNDFNELLKILKDKYPNLNNIDLLDNKIIYPFINDNYTPNTAAYGEILADMMELNGQHNQLLRLIRDEMTNQVNATSNFLNALIFTHTNQKVSEQQGINLLHLLYNLSIELRKTDVMNQDVKAALENFLAMSKMVEEKFDPTRVDLINLK